VTTAQDSIRTTAIARMASLAGAGTRVGLNYLKHYGSRALARNPSEADLHERNASEVYRTFSELKGGPLKLAQMLSIDQNLLPAAYARLFSQAQHSAPPLSYPLVARTFRREFGHDPTEMFDTFSREALHGASIGQVHKATKNGRPLAVKIQYPGVATSLRSDLRFVKPIALQVLGLRESDIAEYFHEVESKLLEETDYVRERERSQELAAACAHIPGLHFPRFYPELCSPRILTMDWVEGITLDRFADGSASQDERDNVGQALWDFYDHQVHRLLRFHADPHPGNFIIRDGEVWVLDFGCTKEISPEFHRKMFRFVDPAIIDDRQALEAALHDFALFLPTDKAADKERVISSVRKWLALLARPFHSGTFDFGGESFLRDIYEMGEQNRRDDILRTMTGQRGSADTIYVNRTFFGLYSLLSRLRARVRIPQPVTSY